ncbi:MAG: YidC/Oxa1 family membrane protein insertase [Lachnospiraceae bacterium]
MTSIVLTQYNGAIVGPIAKLIGMIINYLYIGLNQLFGIENIGITIILFTIVVYILMFPLTYKQQKFSKLTAKMNPEIQKIQKKYAGKTDQESRMAMQNETQAVYDKYGVSPTGSCLPMLIQFPILLAVYRVVYSIPAYVTSIKEAYTPVVNGIMETNGYQDIITNLISDLNLKRMTINFSGTTTDTANSIIDVLYKFTDKGWDALIDQFPNLSSSILSLQETAHGFNEFLGLDIAFSPLQTIQSSFSSGKYLFIVLALLVPIISGLTQWLNLKLSMAAQGDAMKDNPAMQQMQTMNMMMPIFSVIMVFTLPMGLGLYWIAGAVVRSIQQFFLNRHFDKMDFDKVIEANREKAEEKKAKREGYAKNMIAQNGRMSTRNLSTPQENEEALNRAREYTSNAKPGSMASKANLVNEYNNRNNK